MRDLKLVLIPALCLITAALLAPIYAQDAAQDIPTCGAALEKLWSDASGACINKPHGYICNGGAPPAAEPSGLVSNALAPLGALVDAGTVDALRTPPLTPETGSIGVAWIRLPDPNTVTALVIGDVTMFDVSPPDFAAWTASIVQTNPAQPGCADAPRSAVILQSTGGLARVAVNSTSLSFYGTVLVTTDDANTTFVGLEGETTVLAVGQQQLLLPGEQTSVAHPPGNVSTASTPPSAPIPLNEAYLTNLPVPLFDRPLILPQPGYASTQGAVNLRAAPDLYASVITQVPGGQPLTILGRNPDYTWFHVRLEDGQTGWMLAELLASNAGTISAVYSETPLPPQRLGELGTRARVTAPAGVNLRRGPDATFPAIGLVNDGTLVDLLARSPYMNGWIKVNVSGTVGWLSLLTLDTQAYLDALPVDYSAPAMPTATPIPGSFGNAFPDPDGGG
ncbi:MAG: SH3 domain-containing protein [Anaerolineae bacterium]